MGKSLSDPDSVLRCTHSAKSKGRQTHARKGKANAASDRRELTVTRQRKTCQSMVFWKLSDALEGHKQPPWLLEALKGTFGFNQKCFLEASKTPHQVW